MAFMSAMVAAAAACGQPPKLRVLAAPLSRVFFGPRPAAGCVRPLRVPNHSDDRLEPRRGSLSLQRQQFGYGILQRPVQVLGVLNAAKTVA